MLRRLAYHSYKGHGYRNLVSSRCLKAPQLLWPTLQVDTSIRRNVHLTNTLCEKVYVKVPQFDDSITQGDIFFEKTVGDLVRMDERIGCIETDKISVAVQSPVDGQIVEILVKDGDTVKSDKTIVVVETENIIFGTPTSQNEIKPHMIHGDRKRSRADRGGLGDDRYFNHPVEDKFEPEIEHPRTQLTMIRANPPGTSYTSSEPLPPGSKPPYIIAGINGGRKKVAIRMSRMRMSIADRLKESQNSMASLTTFNEIDMSSIVKLRRDYGQLFLTKHDVKLGFMSPFMKATAKALIECPALNAYIDANHTVIYHSYIDIGIAVSTQKGLVVPVIKNVQSMSMVDIEKAVRLYSEKANANDIKMEDMEGGTFTISNGGVFGGLLGTPIINECQAGILGIYGIKERPVAINGKVEIRPMTYVALSYDHRLIDGKEAVMFLGRIKELMEDPLRALLEV